MTIERPRFLSEEYELYVPSAGVVITEEENGKAALEQTSLLNRGYVSSGGAGFSANIPESFYLMDTSSQEDSRKARIKNTLQQIATADAVYFYDPLLPVRTTILGKEKPGNRMPILSAEEMIYLGAALATPRVKDIFFERLPRRQSIVREYLQEGPPSMRITEVAGDLSKIPIWVHSQSGEIYRKGME